VHAQLRSAKQRTITTLSLKVRKLPRLNKSQMSVTPPSPLRTAYRQFFGLANCVPFNNTNNHFRRFHLHKEDKITVCRMHMYKLFLQMLAVVCLFVRFPSFRPPQIRVYK